MQTGAVLRSFGIGLTCGLRSMTGPAVVRWRANDPLRLAFAALALGELIGDKLPSAPPRIVPPALIFRALTGAFAGRSIAVAANADTAAGIAAGALGGLIGAFAGYGLRAGTVRLTGLPDPLVALVEDAVAIGGAIAASRP